MSAGGVAHVDGYAEMARWEVASSPELRPGDVVVLDPRAVDELLSVEVRCLDWAELQETARTVCQAHTRRGTTTLALQHTVGLLVLDRNDLVVRLRTNRDPH